MTILTVLAMTAAVAPYKNPNLPVEERVADLVSRMPVNENGELNGDSPSRRPGK